MTKLPKIASEHAARLLGLLNLVILDTWSSSIIAHTHEVS